MAFSKNTLMNLNRWRGNEPPADPLAAQAKRDGFINDILRVSQGQGLQAALDYYHQEVEAERQEYAREHEIRNALRSIHPRGVDDLNTMIGSLDVDISKMSQRGHMLFQETLIQAQGLPETHPCLAWVRAFVKYKPEVCAQTFLYGSWPSMWISARWDGKMVENNLTKTMNPGLIEVVKTCWEMAVDEYVPANSSCGEDGVWTRLPPEQNKGVKGSPVRESGLAGLVDVLVALLNSGAEPEINEQRVSKLKCAIEEHPHFVYSSGSQESLEVAKVNIKRWSLVLIADKRPPALERQSELSLTERRLKF